MLQLKLRDGQVKLLSQIPWTPIVPDDNPKLEITEHLKGADSQSGIVQEQHCVRVAKASSHKHLPCLFMRLVMKL